MTLFGLSPAAFAVGLAALFGGVALLHLLRVRLRRVEVDTLLFFQLAGALRQPRVLPGKPARWLSLLLAALAVFAAWTAFAEPRAGLEAPSRVVVVEPAAGELREQRLQTVRELVAQGGLGPRGAVLAAAPAPMVLLEAGEPAAALDVRAADLPLVAGKQDGVAALRAAQDRLRPGDEIVWVGASAPAAAVTLPVVEHIRGRDAPFALRDVQWVRAGDSTWVQLDVTAPAGARASLQDAAGGEVAAAMFATAPQQVLLGPVPADAGALRLRLAAGAAAYEVALPAPTAEPLRVFVAAELTDELAAALRALCDVDPALTLVGAADDADVLVTDANSETTRPTLSIEPGVGGGQRLAHNATGSPLALSLRDRAHADAPALAATATGVETTVWVEDLAQGAPLALAERPASGDGPARVRIVQWLLEPATHADVPALLSGALHLLGARPTELLAVEGAPTRFPAPHETLSIADALPAAGQYVIPLASRVARWTTEKMERSAHGSVAVHVLAAPAASAAPPGGPEAATAAMGGDGGLAPWLLLVLFAVLAVDAFLFHRGRLP
ncbi:MAG: hypothetical protein H6838_13180 [Planctomycetes bacterium]|nr:hypothetical protein [Planctomycetota bacterium]MCB9886442.1 hypothetical protein [Planctomycetota bacterium]